MDMLNKKPDENHGGVNKRADAKVQKTVLSYLHDLVFLLTGLLLVFVLLFRMVVVSGPSMRTTLLNGDYLLVLSSTLYHNPKQGDVIVASKDSFKDGEPIVKRVIAKAGQKVDIDFDLGTVYVDGVALDEPYTLEPTYTPDGANITLRNNFPMTVDEGCLFVMGDNRNNSKDSRYPDIGLIDEREVLGKVIFLLIPAKDDVTKKRDFSRIGVV